MNAEDPIARLSEALQGASSFRLYQLQAFLEALLNDPKRIAEAAARLHLGQAVHFVDFRTGDLRRGKIIARRATQATVLEEGVRRTWKLPFVALQAAPHTPDGARPYDPPPEPTPREVRDRYRVGDKVTFDDGTGAAIVGVVMRVNPKTASLHTNDGRQWRVDYRLLRHVVDV